ncbi:MAG: copper ion binding protein [bacterium]
MIRNAGIKIEGMSCGHCVKTIEGALVVLDGVHNYKVSLEEKTATVNYDANKIDLDQIKQVIVDCGFEVS